MTNDAEVIQGGILDTRQLVNSELRRTGGDPSHLFEMLEGIVEDREWETLLDKSGKPIGTFKRLIELPLPDGCGFSAEKVMKLLEIEHRYEKRSKKWHKRMTVLRDKVRELLDSEVEALNGHGGDRSNNEQVSDTNLIPDNEYVKRRLKRDDPELLERVASGELSANEAAIRAGIRKRYIRIREDDMQLAASKLIEDLDSGQLGELIDHLLEHYNQHDD